MKPFNAAFWAVTSNHIPIRNVLAGHSTTLKGYKIKYA
jgi:hypothetical protein